MVLPFSRGHGVGLHVVNQYTSVELISEREIKVPESFRPGYPDK